MENITKKIAPHIVLIIAVVIGGGYLIYKNQKVETSTPVVTNSVADTSDWKTYTNTQLGFSFQYPQDLASHSLTNGVEMDVPVNVNDIGLNMYGDITSAKDQATCMPVSYVKGESGYANSIPVQAGPILFSKHLFDGDPGAGMIDFLTTYTTWHANTCYEIRSTYTKANDTTQGNEKVVALTDQILSTFKFTNQTSNAQIGLGGGYSKDNNYVYFSAGSFYAPTVIQGTDSSTFVVLSSTNSLAKDSQHIYSFGQLLSGANVATFTTVSTDVNNPYFKDTSHVWYIAEKGSLILIPGADPATFVYIGGLNSDAKDAGHTYSFDAKGNLVVALSVSAGLQTYANSQYGFSIQYPNDSIDGGVQPFSDYLYVQDSNFNVVKRLKNTSGGLIQISTATSATVVSSCIAYPSNNNEVSNTGNVTINGIQFTKYDLGRVGLSNRFHDRIFSAIRNNTCYRIEIIESWIANPEPAIDAIKEFTPILSTFKFISPATSSASPFITVLSPNGGENWQIGKSYNIKWSTSGLTSKDIVYIRINGTTNAVASNPLITGGSSSPVPGASATQGQFTWKITNDYKPSSVGKVEIYTGQKAQTDSSDNYFTITK